METFDDWSLDGYYANYDAHKWVERVARARAEGLQVRLGALHKECLKVIPMDGNSSQSNCPCGETITGIEVITSHGLEQYSSRFGIVTSNRQEREEIVRSRA